MEKQHPQIEQALSISPIFTIFQQLSLHFLFLIAYNLSMAPITFLSHFYPVYPLYPQMYPASQPIYYTPEQYQLWYSSLPASQQSLNYSPQQYHLWYYTYVYPLAQQSFMTQKTYMNTTTVDAKEKKPSRAQKRRMKKKQLKEEYEREKAEIGRWVDLERRDLVQGMKKIEEQEERAKVKKREKLSHLIEIHKEVYKHMMKRGKAKVARERAGNFRRKTKKPSHIKKMKELYGQVLQGKEQLKMAETKQQEKGKREKDEIGEQVSISKEQTKDKVQSQDQYITQSEQQEQQSQTKAAKTQKPITLIKQQLLSDSPTPAPSSCPRLITYPSAGKLTNHLYNNITLRQWVDHLPSPLLEQLTLKLVNRLAYKQAIKKVTQPQKARPIILAGLHETRRTLWTTLSRKKSKLLILALNIERNPYHRGTDDQILQLLALAGEAKVPVIHTSTRAKLGRAYTGKFGPRVTAVSIINYEGYGDVVEMLLGEWDRLREQYEAM